jgi:hypothetical protein
MKLDTVKKDKRFKRDGQRPACVAMAMTSRPHTEYVASMDTAEPESPGVVSTRYLHEVSAMETRRSRLPFCVWVNSKTGEDPACVVWHEPTPTTRVVHTARCKSEKRCRVRVGVSVRSGVRVSTS